MITKESSILKKADVLDNQREISLHGTKTISAEKAEANPVLEGLAAEGGENFYHYINGLGL